MKKRKIFIIVVSIVLALILSVICFLLIKDKHYTIQARPMIGATAMDNESYIMFADFGTVDFYTIFLHYRDFENFQSNYGALDIVHHYSNDCNYIESGTQIDFEVVELNKKSLVLHYYGVGITSDGKSVDIDDTWKIDMTTLWNGGYAKPELIN